LGSGSVDADQGETLFWRLDLLLADVVVGSAFQLDAGRLAQSVVVVARTAWISYRQSRSRPVWTFDERHPSGRDDFKATAR